MSVKQIEYGVINGEKVFAFVLSNGNLEAEILNYGGVITRLIYKGVDVVLGRDNLAEYLENNGCFGATIGRNANRIENAEFELNGKIYKLSANKGRNNIHGGEVGFNKRVWNAQIKDGDEPSLILTLISPDGEEGFPGEVKIKVTYTITEDNAIKIHYEGTADKDTVLNMTNHTYFNLNGHKSGSIEGHSLWLDSDFYTPNTHECIPCGEIHSVKGTPFDFKTSETLGERIKSDFEQVKMFGGFDHNLVLSGDLEKVSAVLKGDKTGIEMHMHTDQLGVQVYTGNGIQSERVCKGGAVYAPHYAVCLETQGFPNNLKFSHFPSSILKKGEKYDTVTIYKFV